MRVLVIDDSPFICKAVAKALEGTEHEVIDTAMNGQIGVEKYLALQPDIITLDVTMPVMDGLEAAAQIEKLETGTPIVAMTANIMSGEMEIYKSSGIPDYISKPFTSQELWRCLMKYLTPAGQSAAEKNTQFDEIDLDLEFKKVLQRHFLENNQNKYEEIIDAIKADDIKLAHRIAHTLKGNAAQLGRTSLRMAASDVERQLKGGENLATEDQLKTLKAELSDFLQELSLIYS